MSKLPYDVLFDIFSYYDGTHEHPLETLLLVCRLWKEVALCCPEIWSKFDIDLRETSKVLFWANRVPRRLERSKPNSPIRFSLHLYYGFYESCNSPNCPRSDYFCKCTEGIEGVVEDISRALVGPDGSLCARWKEVRIEGARRNILDGVQFFSYPTPNLRSLALSEVCYAMRDVDLVFLPAAPALQEIKIYYCGIPDIPHAEHAVTVHLSEFYGKDPIPETSTKWIEDVYQVRRLMLRVDARGSLWDPYNLPEVLPFLEELTLAGNTLPENIKDVEIPALKKLAIDFGQWSLGSHEEIDSTEDYTRPITCLVKCNGIPFHQLDTLKIKLNQPTPLGINDEDWNAYEKLLRLCTNVTTIYGDECGTAFVLRLFKDDYIGVGHLKSRSVVVSNGTATHTIPSGGAARLQEVDAFAVKLGFPGLGESRTRFLQVISDYYPYSYTYIDPFEY